jgi:hypothetical protein
LALTAGFTPQKFFASRRTSTVVVEIVDTLEKIEAFLPAVDGVIREGLATLERVQIRFYRSGTERSDS